LNAKSTELLLIDGPAGPLEVALDVPQHAPCGIALVAHPHPQQGGTLAKTFHALGYAAVRFNFRGVGRSAGAFDDGIGETEDALAALAHARGRFGGELPVALAGFSFGSYVQTRVAHTVSAERMVLVGPAVNRFAVGAVPADTIVVHGEFDDIVLLADVFEWARPQDLPIIVFPGCGHFFHGRLGQLQRTIAGMWHRRHTALPGA